VTEAAGMVPCRRLARTAQGRPTSPVRITNLARVHRMIWGEGAQMRDRKSAGWKKAPRLPPRDSVAATAILRDPLAARNT
jgi:hypothetical protein